MAGMAMAEVKDVVEVATFINITLRTITIAMDILVLHLIIFLLSYQRHRPSSVDRVTFVTSPAIQYEYALREEILHT